MTTDGFIIFWSIVILFFVPLLIIGLIVGWKTSGGTNCVYCGFPLEGTHGDCFRKNR